MNIILILNVISIIKFYFIKVKHLVKVSKMQSPLKKLTAIYSLKNISMRLTCVFLLYGDWCYIAFASANPDSEREAMIYTLSDRGLQHLFPNRSIMNMEQMI